MPIGYMQATASARGSVAMIDACRAEFNPEKISLACGPSRPHMNYRR